MVKFLLAIFLFCAGGLIFSDEPFHSTAYINRPGSTDLLISCSNYQASHFFNKESKKLNSYNRFERKSFYFFGERALDCCNSLWINGGYSIVRERLHRNSFGLNDFQLGWKRLLHQKEQSVYTLQLAGIFPGGDKKSSVRYGEWGGQISFLFSNVFSFRKRCGWYDLELGYRNYFGFPSNRLLINGSVGCNFLKSISLILTAKFDYALKDGKSKANLNHIVLHPNYRLLNLQAELYVRVFSRISFIAGGFSHVWGQNVGAGGGFYGGAWFYF